MHVIVRDDAGDETEEVGKWNGEGISKYVAPVSGKQEKGDGEEK